MPASSSTLLRRLERIQDDFSEEATASKHELLARLERRRLAEAGEVYRLHEALSFLHAYPDDRGIRARAGRLLRDFSKRSDLQRLAGDLIDSGIQGTEIHYSFCWTTAHWLETNWPGCLSIDWEQFEKGNKLWGVLYTLLPFTESLILDETGFDPETLVQELKKESESDAGFVIRRVSRSLGDDDTREIVYEDLDIPCILSPGRGRPARTAARYRPSPVVYQTRPLDRSRPDLEEACSIPPRAVESVSIREGRKLIDMARAAMVTRARDLYAFEYGDERDVRLIDCEDGLQFAAIGIRPEARLMLDTVYGFLTLKNGIPIGYLLTRSYFNSSEVAYNVFDAFRGGESARIYGKALAMTRHLFGADTFTVEPYQLGHDNDEGLESGAWWFYHKLGFRPLDPAVKKLVRAELARMRRDPGHRSSPEVLQELSARNMFLFLDEPRRDIRGLIPLEKIGVAVSRYLARRFGADREKAMLVCEKEAARRLGLHSFRGFTASERLAFQRWSPLVLSLPGTTRWNDDDRRALVEVVRSKGGRRESDYLFHFDAHHKLRRALLRLADQAGS